MHLEEKVISKLKHDERPRCPACGRADCKLILVTIFVMGKGPEKIHPQDWSRN